MPPVAGALFWVRGLIERIEPPMVQLKQTMPMMLETEEGKEVTKTYTSVLANLRSFEGAQYEAWGAGVDEVSQSKLKQCADALAATPRHRRPRPPPFRSLTLRATPPTRAPPQP